MTCSAAGLTHTTFGGVFTASSLPVSVATTRVTSRRTASPTSTATNTFAYAHDSRSGIRRSDLGREGGHHDQIAQHVDRPVRRHRLDHLAAAGKTERAHLSPSPPIDGDADRADRLLLAAAAGPGNAGDGDADIHAGALANARRHRERDRLAHRAVLGDQRFGHVEQLDLRAIAVGHDAALDVVGAAGNVRHARRREAARAGLGKRDPPAARAQQLADHGFEHRAVGADQIRAERLRQLRHRRVRDAAAAERGIGGLRHQVQLDLPEARENRRLDRAASDSSHCE